MSNAHHNSEASTSAFLLGSTTSQQNSKYKAYASAVDKALKSFESTTEWADLIAALVKLGKVFSSHAKSFNDIPNSLTVSKRLSQCLHPALPSGVHVKALDTYRQVFLILGRTQNLAKYLFLYAAGLFPLMDHCGIKVKSELLSIFEQFLLPLGPDLRSALPGLITALLLALEEGTEFYGRAFNLLDQLIDKVGSDAFYICFWQAVSGNPSARLPALIFVNAKVEKRKTASSDDLLMTICGGGQASDHMLKALCAVADDTGSPLIQRHLLDFLCSALPIDSDWIPPSKLVQLLRRCLFVVLRRDMSLNRRLYQWLLNRSNDMAFAGLPVDGKEDSLDLAFFKRHTLPLVKAAIHDYLQSDSVEIVPTIGAGTLRYGTMRKTAQTQFPEVRVCRLLHYMLDRPELGQVVLEESLADLLETFCKKDEKLLRKFQTECEEIDPTFGNYWDLQCTGNAESKGTADEKEQNERAEEIRKNFNALLNSLEPSFIWNYFEKFFTRLSQSGKGGDESENGSLQEEVDENEKSDFLTPAKMTSTQKRFRNLFPVMILYAIRNLQLDSHGDIRGRHLPRLLQNILSGIDIRQKGGHGDAAFSFDNLIALIAICRHLLAEINQNNVSIVFESIHDNVEGSPSKKNVKCNKELTEEQKLVEFSLEACLQLFASLCEWYGESREQQKIGLLTAISIFVRDFADFPFYSLQALTALTNPHSPCKSLTDSIYAASSNRQHQQPNKNRFEWLKSLINVIDPSSWRTTADAFDFDMRSRLFDLFLYLCVRSVSMIEQHAAVLGRMQSQKSSSHYSLADDKKTTTTVLLKPFLSETDLDQIEKSELFKKSASVLWERFSESTELDRLQNVCLLLLRLHSRRINDSSSDVENLIVAELTSANKMISGEAARKFRELWVFCRSSQIEEVYSGIPLKPMNRVVMLLIGFIADDSLNSEQVELRALAHSWFQDCARNNDLHKILQMLTLILLNPTTARVSIQFVQMRQRITSEQLPSLPEGANCISLATVSGKQTFNHVCKDVDAAAQKQQSPFHQNGNSWSDYSYINCDPRANWVGELNRQLLLPSNNTATFAQQKSSGLDAKSMENDVANPSDKNPNAIRKTHNRTLSDIPQFDTDAESVDSFSLDTSLDQEVVDVLQYIVDTVCQPEEEEEDGEQKMADKSTNISSTSDKQELNAERSFTNNDEVFGQTNKMDSARDRCASAAQEADEISVVGSLITSNAAAAALPKLSTYGSGDTIKRIRTGHRRQDSLQESIFSTGTQELRLFDPTELPNSTCPGDYKQPLLDETFSHMLFYAESPSMVDLNRAEKLFRTIDTLLKSGIVGRQIVSCMLFTNISPLQSHRERASICGVSASVSQQLMDFMARHYRHIQGEGFWELPNEKEENGGGDSVAENKNQQKFSTLFEIFSTVILYFFRSYFLNSPTNYVSEADLVIAWKCKIAALDCFAELLRILDGIIRDASSKEFATFVQHIYRQTKAQKVVLTLMLAAVPTPQNKGWKMPLTMDIAEFNSGPQRNNSNFRDLIYAYHRSLLNLASSLVILENSLLIGIRYFNSQSSYGIHGNFGVHHHQITENQINYNSSQNRSTIREARYSVVELRLFLGVVLNALKRCPERHELWLQFLIGILPYLDRALSTFVVHVTEQICRNLYDCIFINSPTTVDYFQTLNSPPPINVAFLMDHPKSPMHFVDYRIATRHNNENNNFSGSPMISPRGIIKYPANYILILTESLMSILHFSTLDNNLSFLVSPQMLARNSATSFSSYAQQLGGNHGNRPPSPNRNAVSVTASSTHSGSAFSSSNMTSMVGSAISVIPGTGLINNLFGRVFTSADNSMNLSNNSRNEQTGKTLEWLEAQRELLKRLPSMLAILADIWAFVVSNACGGNCNSTNASNSSFGTYRAISTLVLDILNPIAKKQKNTLINSLGIVWMFRSSNNHSMEHSTGKIADHSQCSFAYSPQQTNIAKLALRLKALSLNSIILCVNETLKEASTNKMRSGFLDKQNGGAYNLDVSLLELLHECTRQVSVTELKDSWSALSILFNESPLGQLPARASFLEFMILVDFVRRCGSQTIVEDRQISKAILDVSQKLIDAINSIVGWQLESTTWLKRTLVVRQDATNQKTMPDLSPVLDQKTTMSSTGLSASALPSEANSIRGSTISLSGVPPSRLSAPLDIQSTSSGIDMKKNASSLRSSLKDHHGAGAGANKKDPTDSTQAIFLMAENLTELIDSVTRSEDKEKLLPTLQAVWNNTLPYLKSKSAKNVRSFLASSQLLASMSSFNYMRSVWKKNAMELLWDNAFFKMDIHALKHWLIVIDNLMTNDKTSFKELLTRITTSTTTTLSTLITSKEQEYEMRSQYLKRLAFVVLSSDSDQYNGQLNEIQERLTENLRLCQMPVIHTQVFTCYRVLLIRMSPSSFVSIWPSMITELVQVLSQMELHIHAANTSTIDEQKSAKDEQQMQLFLAACKLLETLCTLPSGYVAQFQMCRWTFVAPMSAKSMSDVFVPYAVRLNRLLSIRYGQLTMDDLALHSVSLFNVKTLTSLQETHPLFFSLAQQNNQLGAISTLQNGQLSPTSDYRENGELSGNEQPHSLDGTLPLKGAIARIEHSLYVDFAEHWQL